MRIVFTICSNNYLAQASILGASLQKHEPGSTFIIVVCDTKHPDIDYALPAAEIIFIADIEPMIDELAIKYNIIELNTCVKPKVIAYLFETRKAQQVIYLDPDIQVYQPLTALYSQLEHASILLTPHIYTPIEIDQKKPGENTFLNYGLYNLGFIALRNDDEVHKLVSWWKAHTYTQGFIAVNKGIFVDQLPMNYAPVFFKNVHILQDRGLNMAPWNLHERYLSCKHGEYVVNDTEVLTFYHFSSFMLDSNELPLFHYDRFRLADRADLHVLYKNYNEALRNAKHVFYQQFKSYYSILYETAIREKNEKEWQRKPLLKRIFSKRK